MTVAAIPAGTAHTKLPKDLLRELTKDLQAVATWKSLTPLARNEWICWVLEPKHDDTRARRVERTVGELASGKRRPCCWIGCIHRTDKAISPSVRWAIEKRSKPKKA